MTFFSETKKQVSAFIESYLDRKRVEFRRVNRWGPDVLNKIRPFVRTGKMLRGGLVVLGYRLCGKRATDRILPAAAAVEFIQTALLIHDDIIDQDTLRRGGPAVHVQYSSQAQGENVGDPEHFGAGMGICAGDIGFFLAFELLAALPISTSKKQAVLELWARELSFVGLGQMQDFALGVASSAASEKDILDLYRFKTARYSFSVPLMSGAVLGGGSPTLLESLETLGESLGLLFQLRDDELGLFGNQDELGKPVGSDIRENKKTLFHTYLLRKADTDDRRRLERLFGNRDLNETQVREVRDLLEKYRIREEVRSRMDRLMRRASTELQDLEATSRAKRVLRELLSYVGERSR
jgi:geranylgeranyl diphosphate synthase type I